MSPVEIVAIVLAGLAAGTINTVVGSGTLVTFPTLLAIGVPPVTANVSNSIGLVPGSISGAIGYRQELAGQWRRAARLVPASALGAVIGAVLLLVLPAALLTGCAAPSTHSAPACPALPLPPSLSEPIPQQSYSDSVRALLQTWQQKLTPTQVTR